jgi:hypothetical protein
MHDGIPVAFIPCAKGGSSIEQWQPGTDHNDASTLYGSMHRRILAVGGSAKGVLFFQGETDAGNDTSEADYESLLNTYVDAVAEDFTGLQVMVGQIGSSDVTGLDAIRLAQANVVTTNVNALQGPIMYDINTEDEGGDYVHFRSDADIDEFGLRWYLSIYKGFYGGAFGAGPKVNSENIRYDEASNTIQVPFVFEDDATIYPASTITASGFKVYNDNVLVTIDAVTFEDDTVDLTLDTLLDVTAPIELTYASTNDGVENAIWDTNKLPAAPFYKLEVQTGEITTYTK